MYKSLNKKTRKEYKQETMRRKQLSIKENRTKVSQTEVLAHFHEMCDCGIDVSQALGDILARVEKMRDQVEEIIKNHRIHSSE